MISIPVESPTIDGLYIFFSFILTPYFLQEGCETHFNLYLSEI